MWVAGNVVAGVDGAAGVGAAAGNNVPAGADVVAGVDAVADDALHREIGGVAALLVVEELVAGADEQNDGYEQMPVGGGGAVHDPREKAKDFRVRSHWHKSQESASEIGAKRMA